MKNHYAILSAITLSALMPVVALADDLPAVPTSSLAACINGKMNIWIAKAGATSTNLWFQRKSLEFPGSDWESVKFTLYTSRGTIEVGMKDNYLMYSSADFYGVAMFRVAETNAAGEHAGWLEVGPVTNYIRRVMSEYKFTGNGLSGDYINGTAGACRETSSGKTGTNTLHCAMAATKPVGVSMIRYLPRQDSTGMSRLANSYFQCSDDGFTNDVRNLSEPFTSAPYGQVIEIPLDKPVTARYFRLFRLVNDYLSIDEIEYVSDVPTKPFNISATRSDYTNGYPAVTWSVPADNMCTTGVVQRALSAAGPFADASAWSDATTGGTFVDSNAVVGVTYYYRVKAWSVGGGIRGFYYSDVVSYRRSRRLDRSWDDLTTLNDGVSIMQPFKWVGKSGYVTGGNNMWKAFDDDIATIPEITTWTNAPGEAASDANRVYNAAMGVDLGEQYHISGVLLYPREKQTGRVAVTAICGADTDAFLGDYSILSPKLSEVTKIQWYYISTTNMVDQFRYAFLYSPTQGWSYGNVAELGFFGYSDQDIIDSGLLIPPTTVSCETNSTGVVVSWDRGWNNASYRVERSRADAETWVPVASLETNVFSYVDMTVPRKGTWQWRVTSVSENSDTISSLPCPCYYDPHIGMVIIIF